jgi:hypothetical protein
LAFDGAVPGKSPARRHTWCVAPAKPVVQRPLRTIFNEKQLKISAKILAFYEGAVRAGGVNEFRLYEALR